MSGSYPSQTELNVPSLTLQSSLTSNAVKVTLRRKFCIFSFSASIRSRFSTSTNLSNLAQALQLSWRRSSVREFKMTSTFLPLVAASTAGRNVESKELKMFCLLISYLWTTKSFLFSVLTVVKTLISLARQGGRNDANVDWSSLLLHLEVERFGLQPFQAHRRQNG